MAFPPDLRQKTPPPYVKPPGATPEASPTGTNTSLQVPGTPPAADSGYDPSQPGSNPTMAPQQPQAQLAPSKPTGYEQAVVAPPQAAPPPLPPSLDIKLIKQDAAENKWVHETTLDHKGREATVSFTDRMPSSYSVNGFIHVEVPGKKQGKDAWIRLSDPLGAGANGTVFPGTTGGTMRVNKKSRPIAPVEVAVKQLTPKPTQSEKAFKDAAYLEAAQMRQSPGSENTQLYFVKNAYGVTEAYLVSDLHVGDGHTLFPTVESGKPAKDYRTTGDAERASLRLKFVIDDVASQIGSKTRDDIAHNDVKLDNVLLQNINGQIHAVLGDPGSVTQVGGGDLLVDNDYRPPELLLPQAFDGKPSGEKADVWRTGVMAFEALVGELPQFASKPLAEKQAMAAAGTYAGLVQSNIDAAFATPPPGSMLAGLSDAEKATWKAVLTRTLSADQPSRCDTTELRGLLFSSDEAMLKERSRMNWDDVLQRH